MGREGSAVSRSRAEVEAFLVTHAREAFERHEISSRSEDGSRWMLVERRANGVWDHNLSCEVAVLFDGFIVVHGDFETCAWRWRGSFDPRSVVARTATTTDLTYLREKAQLGLDDRHLVEERDGEVLEHDLIAIRDAWEENHGKPPDGDVIEALDDAIDRVYGGADHDECEDIIRKLYGCSDVIDSEDIGMLGYVTTARVIRAQAAVARLHSLLLKEES